MGDVKTKIFCKDPNTLFENKTVKQEELTKYVNLSVRTKERFVTNNTNNMSYTSFNSGDYTYVSNGNTDGPYQSTSYVDISFTDNKLGAVRNRELFGVDSIDISFDAQLFPVVTMEFTDIRGQFLTQMNDKYVANEIIEETERQIAKEKDEKKKNELNDIINSQKAIATSKIFFETLFQFPYPIFTLTVKGYYGPVVRFNLSVSDFKSRFDSTTGNFKIIVSFIGNLYGCLSEIPASYVLTSPYFDNKVLWNVESKNFKFDDGDEIPDIITFLSRYEKLISGKSDNNLNLETTNISAYSNMLKKKNAYETLKGALESYNGELDEEIKNNEKTKVKSIRLNKNNGKELNYPLEYYIRKKTLENIPKINEILEKNKKYFSDDDVSEIKNRITKNMYMFYFIVSGGEGILNRRKLENNVNFDSVDSLNDYDLDNKVIVNPSNENEKFLTITPFNESEMIEKQVNNIELKKNGEGFLHENERENNIYNFLKTFTTTTFNYYTTTKRLIYNEYDKVKVFYYYKDFSDILKSLNKKIKKIEEELEELKDIAEEDVKSICRSVLGFNPTLKNIYHMIFAHLNVLVKQINKNVVNEINSGTHNRGWSEYYFGGYTTDVSNPYDTVPPFPLVANSEDGKVIFPNVFENFKNEPEVRFVENLVNNLQQYSYLLKDEFYEINKSEGEISINTDWYPQFPSDIVYGKNPYDVAFKGLSKNDDKIVSNIIYLFGLRLRNNMLFGFVKNEDFIRNEIMNICSSTPHKQSVELRKKIKECFENNSKITFDGVFQRNFNITKRGEQYTVNGTYKNTTEKFFEAILYADTINDYKRNIDTNINTENIYKVKGNVFNNTIFHIPNENMDMFLEKVEKIGYNNENLCEYDNGILENGYVIDNNRLFIWGNGGTIAKRKITNNFEIRSDENLEHKKAIRFFSDCMMLETKNTLSKGKEGLITDNGTSLLNTADDIVFNEGNKTSLYKVVLYDILKIGCCLYCQKELVGKELKIDDRRPILLKKESFIYGLFKPSSDRCKRLPKIDKKYQDFFIDAFKTWLNSEDVYVNLFDNKVYSYNHYYDRIIPRSGRFEKNNDEYYNTADPFKKTIYVGIIENNFTYNKNKKENGTLNTSISENAVNRVVINKLNDYGATYEESAKEIKNNSEVALEEKTNVYYSIKNFFDKWLCGETDNELKIFNVIKENVKFFDNHLNDISNEFYPNLKGVVELLEKHLTEPSSSLIELLSDIAQANDSLFLTLPTPMRQIKGDEEFNDMFSPKTWSSGETESNTFVVMKSGEASHHLADIDSNFADDGVDLVNDYIGASINGEAGAFEIKYGNMNQNYFKSIDVNMDSPTMTDESIANLINLSQAGKDGIVSRAYTMKNSLFPVYANRSYNCTVNMMGDMAIMPLMYFQLSNVPMFRGVYLITNVKHKITPQDFSTTFTGTRVSRFTPPSSKTPILLENLLEKYGEDAEYTKPVENVFNENNSNITVNNDDINEIKTFLDLLYKNKLNGKVYHNDKSSIEERNILINYNSNYLHIFGENVKNGIRNLKDDGGCEDGVIYLLYDIYKCVCEYNELPNTRKIHIFITSSKRNGSGKSQHNKGQAIDIQGSYNGTSNDNDATLKLFALVHTYKKRIDQLIWENNTKDNNTDKPRIIHFSSKFWNRNDVFQAYVKNGETTTTKDSKKQSNLFKYIVNEYKYE